MEANAFTGLASLLRLSLYGNRIVTVSPASFLGVGVNLTRINLGGNQLATVPTEAIRPLIALQRLQLQENSIRGPLSSGDFARQGSAASLDVLNLANNEISRLEEGLFAGLESINSLDFEVNRIAVIDDAAFRGIEGIWVFGFILCTSISLIFCFVFRDTGMAQVGRESADCGAARRSGQSDQTSRARPSRKSN